MTFLNLKRGDILQDKYEIIRSISSGSLSTIYLCKDLSMEKKCVVKEIWGGRLPDEQKNLASETYEKEIKILRSLRHPGIPRFIDNFSIGTWHYLVMEYVEGKTLHAIVKERKQPMPVKVAVFWAIKICDILHFLHNRAMPIIFRNLSPSNVMLMETGDIKLIDFGLARFFDDMKSRDTHILGTFGFAAPEQYGTKQTSPQTDFYSLGTTLYYLLTLQNTHEFLFNFPPIKRFNPNIPTWLEKVIARCLEKEPKKRYKDAQTLKSELERGYSTLKD